MSTPENKSDTPEINYEQRYKDTQAAFTSKSQESAKLARDKAELEAELAALKGEVKPQLNLSVEEVDALEQLKNTDPEAWREQLNSYEAEARVTLNNKILEAKNTASQQLDSMSKKQTLEAFNGAHQDLQLTSELLDFEIPPRITKKFENGTITYNEYLNESYNYLKTPKVVVGTNKTLNQPDLTQSGGDETPTNDKKQQTIKQVWDNF